MLIACSLGTVSAFAAEGEEPTPVDLRDYTVTLQYASATYTGKALRPTVKVRYNDIALVQGQDYKVLPSNSISGVFQKQKSGQRHHSPFSTASVCTATWLVKDRIKANTSCATALVE